MEQNNIAIMIKIAAVQFEKSANPAMAEYGITFSQFKILKYLMINSWKPARQIDIENFFIMTNPTVTGLLNNLEKKGMIERRPNPDDGRSKLIFPTEKTLAMEEDLRRLSREIDERFTAVLSDDEKEQMRVLLGKIINA